VVVNVAVADAPAFKSSLQVDVPLHAPDQPENLEPDLAVAVNVTVVPLANDALQDELQLTPEGELLIVPAPLPALCTVSFSRGLNVAVTEVLAFRVTLQVDVPPHAPDQPENTEPDLGIAVSVMDVPLENLALHETAQLMPVGLLVMVPDPPPVL
jgi:hypothetical protein